MFTIQRIVLLTIGKAMVKLKMYNGNLSWIWDKEVKLEKLEDMITVYEEHIQNLEKENKELKAQVVFLKHLFLILIHNPSSYIIL